MHIKALTARFRTPPQAAAVKLTSRIHALITHKHKRNQLFRAPAKKAVARAAAAGRTQSRKRREWSNCTLTTAGQKKIFGSQCWTVGQPPSNLTDAQSFRLWGQRTYSSGSISPLWPAVKTRVCPSPLSRSSPPPPVGHTVFKGFTWEQNLTTSGQTGPVRPHPSSCRPVLAPAVRRRRAGVGPRVL